MTAISQNCELKVLFFPKADIPYRTRNGVVVSHKYSDMVRRDWADMLKDVQDYNPTISLDWAGQPEFSTIDGSLTFCRFHKDGRVTFGAAAREKTAGREDVSGWMLRCRYAPLDCKIGNTTLDAGNFDSNWEVLEGQWQTLNPVTNPQATRISNTGTAVTARAQSKGTIAARRGLCWDIHCVGILDASGPSPRVRVIGQKKKYSVLLPHGAKPAVQIPNGTGGYSTIRTLKDLPNVDLSRGDYQVEMFILNDRLIVGVNGSYFHVQEMKAPQRPNGPPTPIKCEIPEGPVALNAHNCRITGGVKLIKWATPEDTAYIGSFAVEVDKKTSLPAATNLVPHATGCTPGGTVISATATVTEGDTGSTIEYIVTLTASPAGIDTPFVTKCVIYKAPDWTTPARSGIDARPALSDWSVTLAMPPIVSGAEASLTLDRKMLSELVDPDWEDYIAEDCMCEIYARWQQKDDVTGAISYVPSGGTTYRLFVGYVHYIHKETTGYNQNSMTVNLRDPMLRLQGNNARIDYKYPPLDWVFMDGAATGKAAADDANPPTSYNPEQLKIYGADCVKEIVRIALGDDADTINGNGDARRFLPRDENDNIIHPPLLSTDSDAGGLLALYGALGQAVTQNGWYFPPPFGDDAETWIKKIGGEIDRCVAFYGWPAGSATTTNWPSFCYGRITEFLLQLHPNRSTFIRIPDSNYISGDVNKLLSMASTETRPERNINRVLALGEAPTGGLEAVLPSLRMGEARLPANDARSAENSWEKTLILRNSLYQLPGAAEAIAMKLISDITGLLMQFPVLTFRGLPVQWGSICVVQANGSGSDATLGLHNIPFRVERVRHYGNAAEEVNEWKTQVHVRPLSNSELAAIPA